MPRNFMSGPDFPRGHLHIIPRFAMFSKNQLKQKQVIHLGDTGGHWHAYTKLTWSRRQDSSGFSSSWFSSPQMEPFLGISPKDKQGSVQPKTTHWMSRVLPRLQGHHQHESSPWKVICKTTAIACYESRSNIKT